MTVELIGFIALAAAFIGIFSEPIFLVRAFFFSTLLGSAAASILEFLGNTNISPAHLLLGFLTIKLLSDRAIIQKAVQGLALGRPGFWLLLTVMYCVFSAYYMPILFAGQTFVFPVRFVTDVSAVVLAPATSNLTQSIYLVGDFICFFVLWGYQYEPEKLRALGNTAIAVAILNLVFVVLDLVTFATGTTDLLAFIRNANYAVLSLDEIAGFKRIIGSFNEASSFGSATLTYFAFTLSLWMNGIRPRLTLSLSALCLLALVFSTSTTSYVGLGVFLIFTYFIVLGRTLLRPLTTQMVTFLVGAPIMLLIVGFGIALNESLSQYLMSLADTMVFNKMSTQSGVERSTWNAQAVQVFFDTYGFGAGNGSLRASSFPLAVLGNLGIVGTTMFGFFFLTLFMQKEPAGLAPLDSSFRKAAKSACIALLITVTISGALTDLGLSFFVFASIACSRPIGRVARNPRRINLSEYPSEQHQPR